MNPYRELIHEVRDHECGLHESDAKFESVLPPHLRGRRHELLSYVFGVSPGTRFGRYRFYADAERAAEWERRIGWLYRC